MIFAVHINSTAKKQITVLLHEQSISFNILKAFVFKDLLNIFLQLVFTAVFTAAVGVKFPFHK